MTITNGFSRGGADTPELVPDSGSGYWRPYDDPPLLTPQMTAGPAATDPPDREKLARYLAALVASRACPVHVTVAFNAIYFGYGIAEGGYVGGPLELDVFPRVCLGETVDALPVGAMVNVVTGAESLPAEIVYKEGAHPGLGDGALPGWTPGWLAGAPAGALGPAEVDDSAPSVVRERWVADTDAFGLGPADARIDRWRRKGRWLDRFGHLVMDARYPSAAEADLDDTAYYVRFLLTRGRDLVHNRLAPAPLPTLVPPGGGAGALEAALVGLLGTIRETLRGLPDVRMQGDYAFTQASYTRRISDAGSLGAAVLGDLAASVSRTALPSPRRAGLLRPGPTHTALGPLLRGLPEIERRLSGLAYPEAVCHANAVFWDYTRRDSDEATGLLPNGVHLRLDDPWQGGGVWRAEYQGAVPGGQDHGTPMGLGWKEHLPKEDVAVEPAPLEGPGTEGPAPEAPQDAAAGSQRAPGPPWAPDDSGIGVCSVLSLADTQVDWTQTLRLKHTLQDVLTLPPGVTEQLQQAGWAHRELRVELDHDGEPLAPEDRAFLVTLEPDSGGAEPTGLTGLAWPLEFFPGIVLTCSWARAGGVVRVRSTLLALPVVIDDEEIRHRYDRQVLTRDLAPGSPRRGRSAPAALTPEGQVLRAVRVLGLLDQYGRAMLPEDRMAEAVRGTSPDGAAPDTDTVRAAVAELVTTGALSTEHGSLGGSGRAEYPARAGQPPVRLLCYTPDRAEKQPAQSATGEERPGHSHPRGAHRVHHHLRRIGHLGHQPSDEARAAYREDMRRFGLVGSSDIPPGYTYVPDHTRGR